MGMGRGGETRCRWEGQVQFCQARYVWRKKKRCIWEGQVLVCMVGYMCGKMIGAHGRGRSNSAWGGGGEDKVESMQEGQMHF